MTCERCGHECERKNWMQRYCADCRSVARKEYEKNRRSENPERFLQPVREWRARHPEYEQERRAKDPSRHRINNHERRARLRNAYRDGTAEAAIAVLYGTPCYYCGDPGEHIDHKIPLVRGGSHTAVNLVSACASCNWAKRDKTDEEFILWLTNAQASAIL